MNILRKAVRAGRRLGRAARPVPKPSPADQAVRACIALIDAGKPGEALDRARAGQRDWPSHPRFIRAEARALAMMGRPDAAAQALDRLDALTDDKASLDPLRRTIAQARVTKAEAERDLDSALKLALEAQATWPDAEFFLRAEARILAQLKRFKDAEDILRRLESLVPDPADLDPLRKTILRARASAAQMSDDLEEALRLTESGLAAWPDGTEFHRLRTRLLILLGREADALEQIDRLLALGDPAERVKSLLHDTLRKQQIAFFEAGAFEAAVAAWFGQAASYPLPVPSPNALVDNLLAALDAAAPAGPDRAPVLDLLARLNAAACAGQDGATRAALDEILDTLPSVDWLPRYIRLFHRALDDTTGLTALETLGAAMLALDSARAQALFTSRPGEAMSLVITFSRGEITTRHPDMALRLADVFLAALGPSIEGYSLRARVHFQLENFLKSQDDIAKALALDPYAFQTLQTEFLLLATSGRHDDVARRLEELKRSGRLDAARLAQLAAKGQMTHSALALFQEARAADPQDKPLASAYIKFCYNDGFWGHCLTAFEQAPALRQGHPRIAQDVYGLAAEAGIAPAEIRNDPGLFRAAPAAFKLAVQAPVAPAVLPARAGPEGKRVAVVIGSLGPGGAERQCAILVRTIARDPAAYGIAELKLFCTNLTQNDRSRFLLEDIREAGIEPVEYFSRDREAELVPEVLAHMLPRSRAQVMVQLRQALQEFRPDAIHGILDETIVNACLASLHMGGTRFVGRWGSLPPGSFRQVSQRATDNALYLQGAYRALIARHPNAAFYANASEATRAYETWLDQPPQSFSTIHNGIETDKLRHDPEARREIRAALGIDPDTVVIGTAFRFTEEKRPFKWLDIAQAVTDRAASKVAFIMLGNGPLLLPSETYAADRGIGNVHFAGRQSEIGKWWSAMDLGLMTSSVEGISNTVIEAQLLGRPVVAFDVGGMNEAIRNGVTGQLLPEGHDGDMVSCLVSLVDDAARRAEMSNAATTFVMDAFSAESLARNTAALY